MKHKICVSAPGKLILLGEHSVVYGKPAVIAAVDKRCYVRLIPGKNKKIIITSKNHKNKLTTNFENIISKFDNAQKAWNNYSQHNDIKYLNSITKELVDFPQIIIGQFLNYFNKTTPPPLPMGEGQGEGCGFKLNINSEIPLGAGMGSSAALAVSIIGALYILFYKKFDKKIINEIAFLAEQKKHGLPSGGDNSASAYGGVLMFKKDQIIKPWDFKLPPQISSNLYIANTGMPNETTGEMVGLVRILNENNPTLTEKIFQSQEKLVKDLYLALKKNMPGQIPGIIKMSEANLENLGVVSALVQKIIKDIEGSGGAAKICGGGGKIKAAGMILIYHTNLHALEKVLKFYRLKAGLVALGAEGLRKEK